MGQTDQILLCGCGYEINVDLYCPKLNRVCIELTTEGIKSLYSFSFTLLFVPNEVVTRWRALTAYSVDRWTCDWKVADIKYLNGSSVWFLLHVLSLSFG